MKYYTDGFNIQRNPSPIGGGYTVADENGAMVHREVIRKEGFTNNEGEILGILHALKISSDGDTISTDSMVCLTWINTGRSKARPDLNNVLMECKKIKQEKNINLMWEGRDFNLAGIMNENDTNKYEHVQPS